MSGRPIVALLSRMAQLLVGLVLMGVAVTALKRSALGLGPWDVLHDGIARHTGVDLGVVGIVVGLAVLVLWWPLRLRPGIGTLANVLLVGFVVHRLLPHTSTAHTWPAKLGLMAFGLAVFAIGQGVYLACGLGAGPRDGLMIGFNARFGWSIRLSRTLLETAALIAGIAMGGSFGIGTVIFAFGIGPMVQVTLRWFHFPARTDRIVGSMPAEAVGLAGE
jgi:uncharacterized membrane protein YczE